MRYVQIILTGFASYILGYGFLSGAILSLIVHVIIMAFGTKAGQNA